METRLASPILAPGIGRAGSCASKMWSAVASAKNTPSRATSRALQPAAAPPAFAAGAGAPRPRPNPATGSEPAPALAEAAADPRAHISLALQEVDFTLEPAGDQHVQILVDEDPLHARERLQEGEAFFFPQDKDGRRQSVRPHAVGSHHRDARELHRRPAGAGVDDVRIADSFVFEVALVIAGGGHCRVAHVQDAQDLPGASRMPDPQPPGRAVGPGAQGVDVSAQVHQGPHDPVFLKELYGPVRAVSLRDGAQVDGLSRPGQPGPAVFGVDLKAAEIHPRQRGRELPGIRGSVADEARRRRAGAGRPLAALTAGGTLRRVTGPCAGQHARRLAGRNAVWASLISVTVVLVGLLLRIRPFLDEPPQVH